MLMKQKHRLKMNGQNIIKIVPKMEKEFIIDAKKSNIVANNCISLLYHVDNHKITVYKTAEVDHK